MYTTDNGADVVIAIVVVVVVGLQSVRREANVEGGGRGRAEAIINNWELIKVPDKSMESCPVLSPSLSHTLRSFDCLLRATRSRYDMINNFKITRRVVPAESLLHRRPSAKDRFAVPLTGLIND